MSALRRALRALTSHAMSMPFATLLSLIAIPIGILAIVIGTDISKGFTVVWDRPEPVYVWGVALLLGGYHVASGLLRDKPAMQRAGLFVLALAYAFYGVSVILGLGSGGMVTGPTFCVMALACLLRARVLNRPVVVASERGD